MQGHLQSHNNSEEGSKKLAKGCTVPNHGLGGRKYTSPPPPAFGVWL